MKVIEHTSRHAAKGSDPTDAQGDAQGLDRNLRHATFNIRKGVEYKHVTGEAKQRLIALADSVEALRREIKFG